MSCEVTCVFFVIYWATTGPKQESQATIDRNLWNETEPKQNLFFLAYKLIVPSYFVTEMEIQVTHAAFPLVLPFMDAPVGEG